MTPNDLADMLIEIVPDACHYIERVDNEYFSGLQISIASEKNGIEYHITIRLTDEYLEEDSEVIKPFLAHMINKKKNKRK